MEQLRQLLSDAARLTELELQLPLLQPQLEDLKERVSDLKNDRDWARLTAKNLEEPTFFQRLMGKVAEKQEKAQAEAREASAAYEKAKRECDDLQNRVDTLQAEFAALSGSRDTYEAAREEFLSRGEPSAREQLREMERDAFRPVAVDLVRQIRNALLASRGWMEKEMKSSYYVHQSRRMEYLSLADTYSEKLKSLLTYFPQGSVTLGASMSAPGDYVRSVSTNLSQVDRLNIAVEQSLRVQEQLEAL